MASRARVIISAAINRVDTTVPTFTSATIPAAGTSISLLFSEAVQIGAGGSGGLTITMDGGAVTWTYASGAGTNTLVYTASRTINSTEDCTEFSYVQPTNGIEDLAGNDLASIAAGANRQADVTNSSTVGSYLFSHNTASSSASAPSGVTAVSGTTVFNQSSTGLFTGAGDYCWKYDGELYASFTEQSQVGIFFRFRAKKSTSTWIELRNASGVVQAYFEFRTDRIIRYHGAVGATVLGTPTADAEAVFWIFYQAESGGGGNGVLRIYYNDNSSSESKPAEYGTGITTGTGDAVAQIYFKSPVAGDYYVTKLRVAAEQIGSSPS